MEGRQSVSGNAVAFSQKVLARGAPGEEDLLRKDPRSRGGASRGDRSQALAGAQASAARLSGSTARPSKPW